MLNELAPHVAQERFVVVLPAEVTYCPGLHVVHAVQDEAFVVVV